MTDQGNEGGTNLRLERDAFQTENHRLLVEVMDLRARLDAADTDLLEMHEIANGYERERDTLTAAVARANQERDDLQAWIDRAERKGAIDANMLSAPDALTPPPGGRISKDGP